jgi:hypothetical protein
MKLRPIPFSIEHLKFKIFILVAISFFLFSCNSSNEKAKEEFRKAIPDSVDLSKLIAAYKEDGGYTLLLLKNGDPLHVKKFTFRNDFPVFADTLLFTGTLEFRSLKFDDSYFISDDKVVIVHNQKIIHPCSNWQGQTPWKEVNVWTYARVDK